MQKLTELLLAEGLVTVDQIKEAKEKQLGAKKPLQELFVEMGFLKEEDLTQTVSRLLSMPIVNLEAEPLDTSLIKKLPYEMVKRYGVFPVRKQGNQLILAMSNPMDILALDDVRALTQMEPKPILSAKSNISLFIEKYYLSDEALYQLLKNVVDDKKIGVIDKAARPEAEIFRGEAGPVAKLINFILNDAVKARSSDIHVEPQGEQVRIRYRIDGDLKDVIDIPGKLLSSFVARIKVIAGLDLAETRSPQDGRASIMSAYGRNIDLRVSCIPTYHGEKVVLRILDPLQAKIQLEGLGLTAAELKLLKNACLSPQGMILVTGPTGSGKTSTLYAALNFMKSETKNIVTIEDPIEYLMEGVNQIQVNPVKDVTFATGLRSILRQDPNVILVGEIRDKETADVAFRSSLTGHLVLSTLHTNNAVGSIARLLDIGLEPYLLSSSLILIVAQRLIRLICPHCKEECAPDGDLAQSFRSYVEKFKITRFWRGKGCAQCGFSGFLGRSAIFEILSVDEKIKSLISGRAPEEVIAREASGGQLKLLVESGMERVAAGQTTLGAVAKIAVFGEEAKIPETASADTAPKIRAVPKVLVVDDEENIRQVLEARLNFAGFEVLQAKNGQEAVEYAARFKPDVIVMDVMMPQMDGFAATKALKSQLATAAIPIMLLTAKKDVESELKGLELGADDYMGKPFDGNRLLARVKLLLRRT